MRCCLLGLTVAITLLVPASGESQDLILDFFSQYLDSLRVQAGIPGLSVAIVGGNEILLEQAFGHQDVELAVPAGTDTPYHLDGVTQIVTTALLLGCVEDGHLALDDAVGQYDPDGLDATATVRELMSHTRRGASGPEFAHSLARFDSLTAVVNACTGSPIHEAVGQLFDRLGSTDTVPGPDAAGRFDSQGDTARAARYWHVLERVAAPYAIGGDTQPFASQHPATTLTAAGGLISSVRDVALLEIELRTGVLVRPETMAQAWAAPLGPNDEPLPHALGWFVQSYAGEPIAWQFGMAENASSSLVVVAPTHGLTLVLLANSDGLAKPFDLATGDLTLSPFARVFLELFLR